MALGLGHPDIRWNQLEPTWKKIRRSSEPHRSGGRNPQSHSTAPRDRAPSRSLAMLLTPLTTDLEGLRSLAAAVESAKDANAQ
jgi:hypothetical protein